MLAHYDFHLLSFLRRQESNYRSYMFSLILKYYVIGLAMAAPIGPMSIIIMRRTLQNGLTSGIASGLGTTTIEGSYSALIAFGLTFISDFIVEHKLAFAIVGGCALTVLGGRIFFSKTAVTKTQTTHVNLWRDYLSNVVMTAVNPMTIFSFVAVFVGLGFGNFNGDYKAASLAVLGLMLGSSTWYCSYVAIINLVHKKINEKMIATINRVSGAIIMGFGLIAFWKFLF